MEGLELYYTSFSGQPSRSVVPATRQKKQQKKEGGKNKKYKNLLLRAALSQRSASDAYLAARSQISKISDQRAATRMREPATRMRESAIRIRDAGISDAPA